MSKEKMQIIDDMVTHGDTCVLATMEGNSPHTSLMTYFADHASMKFYFLTRASSRKYKALMKNPHASLLIDRRSDNLSLSIDGYYVPVKKKQTAEAIIRLYLLKYPENEGFASLPDTKLVRIQGVSAELAEAMDVIFTTKLKIS